MDAPPIQYARTEDGTSIAYWAIGSGPTLVICSPAAPSHVRLEWKRPVIRHFYERLAADRTVVRFDFRGAGLSDHSPKRYTLADQAEALAVVLDQLPSGPVDLLANHMAVGPAIRIAADHPERVGHLLLLEPFARSRALKAAQEAVAADRDSGASLQAVQVMGLDGGGEELEAGAAFLRGAYAVGDPEALRKMLTFHPDDRLDDIAVPTMVISSDRFGSDDPTIARSVASRIAGARRASVERPWFGGAGDQWLALINAFCGLPSDHDHDDANIGSSRSSSDNGNPHGLTRREIEVLRHVADGLTNVAIAAALGIGRETVTRHVTHLLRKTGHGNRTQLARYAEQQGFVH